VIPLPQKSPSRRRPPHREELAASRHCRHGTSPGTSADLKCPTSTGICHPDDVDVAPTARPGMKDRTRPARAGWPASRQRKKPLWRTDRQRHTLPVERWNLAVHGECSHRPQPGQRLLAARRPGGKERAGLQAAHAALEVAGPPPSRHGRRAGFRGPASRPANASPPVSPCPTTRAGT
jgi:hypothetical protein